MQMWNNVDTSTERWESKFTLQKIESVLERLRDTGRVREGGWKRGCMKVKCWYNGDLNSVCVVHWKETACNIGDEEDCKSY